MAVPSGKFTTRMVEAGTFRSNPFRLIDVGALGGFNSRWAVLSPDRQMIGFEPQYATQMESDGQVVYPYAVGRTRGEGTINVYQGRALSSFLPIKPEWIERSCVFNEQATLLEQAKVPVIGLDEFNSEHRLGKVDFIKIDTEGTELDILKGAERLLTDGVLGVELEVYFHETHQGRCLFSDVDIYMRGLGFTLFDLKPWRFSKMAMPNMEPTRFGISPFGQVMGGDVVYLRDLAALPPGAAAPAAVDVLKLACFMDLWEMPDCAVELLDKAAAAGWLPPGLLPEGAVDLLVPPVMGRTVTLDIYRNLANLFR